MKRSLLLATATVTTLAVIVTGCTATPLGDPDSAPRIDHIHGIAADPRGDDLFVATHNGIFTLALDGTISGPVGGHDFDAMGFTVSDDSLFASGHPGENTPAELGAPNLGIIRSDDYGNSWSPIALNGTTDFHVLTAGPDDVLYGIPSSQVDLLTSTDGGNTWTERAPLGAADLAVTESGVYAAAEEGVLVSTDGGDSFTPIDAAPVLYALEVRTDGTLLGAGTDGVLWSQDESGAWQQLESLQGAVQALTVVDDRIILVDDRGIVEVSTDGTNVLSPAQ
ncbi:F510_1955 family glycosylhydrolase [Microbacterium sp. KHB019]|uniref:F510_1955 family glycosylhydrolase n=1 Tax=Microbacterium sp. KHB019 TaxID=3129770 RepID=UPI00307B0895